MLCSTADEADGEIQYVDMLRRHMMDGIVMCAHTSHPGDYWTSIHRPIVAFDRVLGDGISSIGSDHEQGGRLIAQMLIRNGAKHVVMIGGPRDQFFDLAARGEVEEGPFDLGKTTFPTVRYYLTLEQELTSAGVKYEYVEAGEVMDFAGYHRAVSNALDKVTTDGVDAVVSSDIGASFCVREALGRGISIPDELQIVAYDGTYLTDLAGMKLTAVAQDFSAIAQSAADHIVQAIANEEVAAANASRKNIPKPFEPNVLIPMTLVPGDTTRWYCASSCVCPVWIASISAASTTGERPSIVVLIIRLVHMCPILPNRTSEFRKMCSVCPILENRSCVM